jgi:pimeloyl-ACP methyl ester carboxylesterase
MLSSCRLRFSRPHGRKTMSTDRRDAAWKAVAAPSRQAYRSLLRAADAASVECQLTNREGLRRFVSRRFRQSVVPSYLPPEVRGENSGAPRRASVQLARDRLADVQKFLDALEHAPGDAVMTPMLQVLAAGVGNLQYQLEVEQGLTGILQFRHEQAARQELDDETTSERQLRIVQQAALPYAERLSLLYRTDLTTAQLCDLFQAQRPRSSTHCLSHGNEQLVLDIDDDLNKQTIYIRGADYNWRTPVERVEMCEPEMTKKTTLHAQYFAIALRLVESLESETALHRSRGVVCVGHGVGGAIATAMALILAGTSYNVKNVVTFGSPKVVVRTLTKVVEAISPLRFVVAGDPLPDVPVSDALGDGFQHIGEIFTMECPLTTAPSATPAAPRHEVAGGDISAEALMGMLSASEEPTEAITDDEETMEAEAAANEAAARAAASRDPYLFSVEHYLALMRDTAVPMTYAEGADAWDDDSAPAGIVHAS